MSSFFSIFSRTKTVTLIMYILNPCAPAELIRDFSTTNVSNGVNGTALQPCVPALLIPYSVLSMFYNKYVPVGYLST
jgi:hypothetical protein